MPELDALQKQYSTTQVRVITLGDDPIDTIKQYARGHAALFLSDASNSVWNAYSQNGYIPLNYVIRQNGKIYNWMEGYDGETIKNWIDSCMIGIEESTQNSALRAQILEISPNPFKTMTMISAKGLGSGNLRIYDLSGRIVKSFSPGSDSKVIWDRKDNNGRVLPAGIYFCVLNAGSHRIVKKLVLMK